MKFVILTKICARSTTTGYVRRCARTVLLFFMCVTFFVCAQLYNFYVVFFLFGGKQIEYIYFYSCIYFFMCVCTFIS